MFGINKITMAYQSKEKMKITVTAVLMTQHRP